jgi:hypothetical protein
MSLAGSPNEVKGSFWCQNNNLISLVGSPNEVGLEFDCSNNKLTSLEGLPKKVWENIIIDLGISLKGLESEIFNKVVLMDKEGYYIRLTKVIKGLAPKGINTNEYLKVLIEQINRNDGTK